jgi:uncharacterized protein (DUF3084 family)
MQKIIKFLMISMAFTALQVVTVKAEEESLDGATHIFSGSEESSEKKKKIEQRDRKTEQRDRKTEQRDQERQDRDRKDTGSHVEENIPIEHDIYSIDRWGIRGGAKGRAAWQNRVQTK